MRILHSVIKLHQSTKVEANEPTAKVCACAKKATNVSLNEAVLACAQFLNINISQAAEKGLERAIAEKQTELWLAENKIALESSNEHVKKHELPLARFVVY